MMKNRLSVWIGRTWNRVIIGLQEFFGDKDLVTCVFCNKTKLRKQTRIIVIFGEHKNMCDKCYDTNFKPFIISNDDAVFGRGKEASNND